MDRSPSLSKLLLTAFEPFGGDIQNSSASLVVQLSAELHIPFRILPTSYERATKLLIEQVNEAHPTMCVLFGQGRSSHALRMERYARNFDSAEIADNDGVIRQGPIVPGDPNRLSTKVEIDNLVARMQANGYDAAVSEDAGGFVCNHVYYEFLRFLVDRELTALFVHVPGPTLDRRAMKTGRELLRIVAANPTSNSA